EVPALVTRGCVEAEEAAAVRPNEDPTLPDGRGGVDVAAGRLRPPQLPARRAERVDLAVGRADVDAAVGRGGRRVERAGGPESLLRRRTPDQAPGPRVERVDVVVVRADVEPLSGERHSALDLVAGLER